MFEVSDVDFIRPCAAFALLYCGEYSCACL